jgi:hypothetical protein
MTINRDLAVRLYAGWGDPPQGDEDDLSDMTFGEFIDANDLRPSEARAIYADVADGVAHHIGGGAAACFTLIARSALPTKPAPATPTRFLVTRVSPGELVHRWTVPATLAKDEDAAIDFVMAMLKSGEEAPADVFVHGDDFVADGRTITWDAEPRS